MPTVYKPLGQVVPAAVTNTTLYTVAAATNVVVSTLCVCNRGVSTTVRIAVRPLGASLDDAHYIIFDAVVAANDSLFLTLGLTLQATDVVTIFAGHANTSFQLYGSEIT